MLQLDRITKQYGDVMALNDVTLRVEAREFVVIRGPSGCGKSTLLLIAGAMLPPTSGVVRVENHDLVGMSSAERANLRAARIGFVFQMFHLVPYLTVLDNVMLASQTSIATRERAAALLEELGLGERMAHKPSALSTGETQRAAVARALINQPALVLADEPTGNLDPQNAAAVYTALRHYRDEGGTVVAVTHGSSATDFADRAIAMRHGQIESTTGATTGA